MCVLPPRRSLRRAFPRCFGEDRESDCRLQNQLEQWRGMQEGNSKKKNPHLCKTKKKTTLKTPVLIFILEGAALNPQTLSPAWCWEKHRVSGHRWPVPSVTPRCGPHSSAASWRSRARAAPGLFITRWKRTRFLQCYVLCRELSLLGNIPGILAETGRQQELYWGLKGWKGARWPCTAHPQQGPCGCWAEKQPPAGNCLPLHNCCIFFPSVIYCLLPPWGEQPAQESKYSKIFGQLPSGKALSRSSEVQEGLY